MPRLTLLFKDRVLSTHSVAGAQFVIGRHPDCDLCIDSLAIAPQHLVLVAQEQNFYLYALAAEQFPVRVNGDLVNDGPLEDNSLIEIGKHQLLYELHPQEESEAAPDASPTPPEPTEPEAPAPPPPPRGHLQLLSGSQLGRLIPLDQPLVRIGRAGAQKIAITYQDGVYRLMALDPAHPPQINGQPIAPDAPAALHTGDEIRIGELRLRFDDGANAAPNASPEGAP